MTYQEWALSKGVLQNSVAYEAMGMAWNAALASGLPEGYKLLRDTTPAERSYPEDTSHENGYYHNECCHCGRMFTGHKRRGICRVCSNTP